MVISLEFTHRVKQFHGCTQVSNFKRYSCRSLWAPLNEEFQKHQQALTALVGWLFLGFFFVWLVLKTFSEPKVIICGFLFKWIIILASFMQVSWILLQLELQHLKYLKSIRNIDYNMCWSFNFYYYFKRSFQL